MSEKYFTLKQKIEFLSENCQEHFDTIVQIERFDDESFQIMKEIAESIKTNDSKKTEEKVEQFYNEQEMTIKWNI